MKALGIDPSLTCTGFAKLLYSNGKYEYETKKVKTKKKDKIENEISRSLEVEKELLDWLDGVDMVILEGYAFGGHNGFSLGELGGVIRRTLYLSQKPFYIVQPSAWRKALFGRGSAPKGEDVKDWVQKELYNQYDLYIDTKKYTTDESDALALALLGSLILQGCPNENVQKIANHEITGGKRNGKRKNNSKSSRS